MTKIILVLATIITIVYGNFKCPLKDGQYEDEVQCDKFYECKDGYPTEKLCPDGLVFDPFNRKINKCDHVFNVDCAERLELQPPQPSKNCPRKNGFFPHPDPTVCNIFYNCVDGQYNENICTAGLHFDENTGICVWPATANRENCRPVGQKLTDGFECPSVRPVDSHGHNVDHPKYAHPEDCQKFYVCLSGVTPREQGCSEGSVYNEKTEMCDTPENVPGW
ncbi:hypothetical protein HCN44_008677 [Aphidius gifuensis]|uniref:Chitin-binding type-2 domain-containing protein n=1 Tax=Aphidius gifuensis TaxID=684658 RepID=A0A835CQB3_APHGI|nr:hypothetical protein HCN44_008677 [Aphidius gifuensis]